MAWLWLSPGPAHLHSPEISPSNCSRQKAKREEASWHGQILIRLSISSFIWLCSPFDGEIFAKPQTSRFCLRINNKLWPDLWSVATLKNVLLFCDANTSAAIVVSVSGCFLVEQGEFQQMSAVSRDQADVSVPDKRSKTSQDHSCDSLRTASLKVVRTVCTPSEQYPGVTRLV